MRPLRFFLTQNKNQTIFPFENTQLMQRNRLKVVNKFYLVSIGETEPPFPPYIIKVVSGSVIFAIPFKKEPSLSKLNYWAFGSGKIKLCSTKFTHFYHKKKILEIEENS